MKTEHFVLKEDGKLYWIQDMPPKNVLYNQGWNMPGSYNYALQSAIDNAVEVSNQMETKWELAQMLKAETAITNKVYSLQCSVDVLPWSLLRIYSTGNAHKSMPIRGDGALVTFEEYKSQSFEKEKEGEEQEDIISEILENFQDYMQDQALGENRRPLNKFIEEELEKFTITRKTNPPKV